MTAAISFPSLRRPAGRLAVRPTRALWLAVLLLLAGLSVPAARAQDQDLVDRLNRLQQELATLQRHVYGGGSSGGDGSGGAAPLVDDAGRPLVARLELRMTQLEDEVRRLTGRVEEVNFQINQVGQRLDTLVGDVDQRLQRLELNQPGASLPPAQGQLGAQQGQQTGSLQAGTTQSGATPQFGQPAQPAGTAQSGTTFDSGPKVLGSVSANDLEAMRQQAGQQPAGAAAGTAQQAAAAPAQQTAALVGGGPKAQYDHAFALLSQANYPAAEQALTAFLGSYPDDPLAGNAKYWLGETYYVRGQFREAAVTFAEGFQKFPNSPKAPDNLLKLGKSLAALGQASDACGTFAELKKRYPDAPATIHQQASAEQQRLGCQ